MKRFKNKDEKVWRKYRNIEWEGLEVNGRRVWEKKVKKVHIRSKLK